MTTLSFGSTDGVTGPPTLDGFIDHDFMASGEPGEPGYTNGFRRTFDGGTLSPVILQGVRVAAGDRLVIGILARFDQSFDADDQVILALKPTPGSSQASARMLVIRPVLAGIGVEAGAGTGANQVKTNVLLPASRWDLWRGNATGAPWTQVSSGLPAIDIRVRSWKPSRPAGSPDECAWSIEVSMPRLAGGNANWLDLADGFGAYANIIRVNPDLGDLQNSVPAGAELTGAVGPNLAIPAWGTGLVPALQTPPGSNPGLGIFFPNGPLSIGVRPVGAGGAPGSQIRGTASADTRDNELLAIVRNSGPPVTGIQATFAFANWGLGVKWTEPATLAPNPTAPSAAIATGADATLATVWTRAQVSAAGFAGATHQCMTATLSAASAVNFVQVATRRNMDFVSLSSLEREAEVSTEGLPDPPAGAAEHDIILRSFAREIRLADLVMAKPGTLGTELVAIASGTLSEGARNVLDQFDLDPDALFNGKVNAGIRRELAVALADHVAIVWLTEGLRRTGNSLTIAGTTYPNLASELGSFGFVAHHVGAADAFSWSITGPGLTRVAPGVLRLRVRPGDRVQLRVRLAMEPGGRAGDIAELPRDPGDRPGGNGDTGGHPHHRPKWWWVLLGLLGLAALRRLLKR